MRGTRTVGIAAVCVALVAAGGCAQFDDSSASPFTPEPSDMAVGEVQPESPQPPESSEPATPPGPLGPCQDADPAVVATCLDTTGGLVVLPDGQHALVGERRTGRILEVTAGQPPREVARVDVDAGADGGLTDIALSPTYAEDNLIYAYVTTGSDNRVVRVAPGDTPKPVLSGIPRGASGNGGSLEFAGAGELMVATGDGGDAAAATDPGSLGGKLLRVRDLTTSGSTRPEIVLTGLGAPGGVCVEPGVATWVTDRMPLQDRLQRVGTDGTVSTPVWTWPDRPGVGGCVAAAGVVAVALEYGKAMSVLAADPKTGAVTAAPGLLAQDRYGALGSASIASDGQLWAGTVNKTSGEPGPTDDRVVKLPPPSGGGGFD
ncbi:PQQ-dependent sugar dehydrogenase [Rhodococcus sp. HNM0569]|uniref:PQQ-dependent sugar dehydrogenase n=1 Tax=Rhodococcus sp. HNM0569 TaxID=2716340 RepID=UPI00146CE708|nr:PQQ-dependent sugar dehydrogenase [Rhodococcus sp. HNM0569]NLU81595.1 oxidoreductase [Rhodococcus sp. HNM0569]